MPRVQRPCDECGKTMWTYPNAARPRRFCSRVCWRESKSTLVTVACQNCSTEFRVPQSQAKDRKYCSVSCKSSNPEFRALLSTSLSGQEISPERRRKSSLTKGGTGEGWRIEGGYKVLTGVYDHPLSPKTGVVFEHRKVLYDKIGPGTHKCHWDCGKILSWGGKSGINTDHLDGDQLNNEPDNLVPSCFGCNRSGKRLRA